MGLFGGGDSSPKPATEPSSVFPADSPGAKMGSVELKHQIMKEFAEGFAVAHAKQLIGKLNNTAFSRCVMNPSSSLSGSESACVTACSEKYLAAFNIVGQEVVKHAQAGKINAIGLL
ncbi:hypothetical protein BT63DRAFT_419503 [Microthyrium microscopicum]|uniref:Mitochondrial import inner membrane translocase subunit n=1 Tax=Microthyrium microscopicum TaxID=703497 RepID=A0A6A6US17_9PEZI|nr:hypothetical protein BT63DRAFT_419503 [Microthyrium microscopicum]